MFFACPACTPPLPLPSQDWPVTICASYSAWKPVNPALSGSQCFANVNGTVNTCSVQTVYKRVGSVSPVLLLAAFSLLSAAFQLAPAVWWATYVRWCDAGVQPLRWVEYSISSTLMVWVILILNGNYDLWILVGVGGLNWACMVFGGLQEHILWAHLALRAGGRASFTFAENTLAHWAGWTSFSLVWLVIISQFTWAIDEAASAAAAHGWHFPLWLKAIIWLQFFLFAIFGLMQALATLAQLGYIRAKYWTYWSSEARARGGGKQSVARVVCFCFGTSTSTQL